MRNEGIIKTLTICTITLIVLMIFNNLALRAVRRQYTIGSSSAASLFNISGQLHEWATYVQRWKDLVSQNKAFTLSEQQYISAEAEIQSLKTENDTLRKSQGLATHLKRTLVPAGIFGVSLMPDGYHALINKGTTDGVAVGQAVISPQGVLFGTVAAVFPSSARVVLITDPGFSATVQVLNGQTSGIVRGAFANGLALSLITQSDQITEGDTLITSGTDLIPAGLVVGTVRHVDNNDTQMFKGVAVNPSMDLSTGSVLVIER